MPDTLNLDFETACDLDLVKVGLDRYSADPSCRVLMAAYRINGDPIQHWQAHEEPIPGELKDALLDPGIQRWAFNAQFERVITRRVLKLKTPIEGWRCSMVLAYMQSFTGSLADVGIQTGLPQDKQKKKDGDRLIKLFSMPQRMTKNQPYIWRNWKTDENDWQEFCDYNCQDVVAEEAIKSRLIRYPIQEDEWRFYHLDQRINDRGMPLDQRFVHNVIWMSEKRKNELLDEMAAITGLVNPNSRDQILPWLQANGYPYDDLQKETVEKALNRAPELWGCLKDAEEVEPVVRVLRCRQWSSKTSISKAVAARRTVGPGGRVRFMYQFCGASRTGRFAGRGVQPQNMERTPKLLDVEESDEKLNITTDLIRDGNYNGFDLWLAEPMLGFTGAMRGMFRALEGCELQAVDFKSVESAGLAWLANCPRLLNVFREDRDPYLDFGTLFYQKPYEAITRAERQICKPPTLACGYGMGPGIVKDGVKTGLLAYAENMGVDMTREQAMRAVTVFREGYPEVPQLWYAYERAIRHVLTTHTPFEVGPVRFEWMKPYLLMRLPSGRYVFYYKPRLEQRTVSTGRMKKIRSRGMAEHGAPAGVLIEVPDTYVKTVFTYLGRNQKTTQWERVEGRGSLIVENCDQAMTRDILKVGLQRLHKAGFYIIGHSHDEAIAMQRIGDNRFTLDLMKELFKAPIEWAPGFPLGASAWQGKFYRK